MQRINLAGQWIGRGPVPVRGLVAIIAKYLDEFEGTPMILYDDPVQRVQCLATIDNKYVGSENAVVLACPPAIMAKHTTCSNPVIVGPNYIVTGTRYNGVSLWNLDGALIRELCPDGGGFKLTLALSNDMIAVSDFNAIRLYRADGELCHELLGHTDHISCMEPVLGGVLGRGLATGSHDHTVRVWDFNGRVKHDYWGHSAEVQALAKLSDGRIASGSWDKTIRVWSASPGCSRETSQCDLLEGHTGGLHVLRSISDNRLASGAYDKTVRIWNLETLECLRILDHSHWVSSLSMIKETLICGLAGPGMHMWSVTGDFPVHLGVVHRPGGNLFGNSVDSLAELPGGKLAARYTDGQVIVYK